MPKTQGNAVATTDLKLTELADQVRAQLHIATGGMLSAGDALREARKLLDGDRQYGQWCKREFPQFKQRYLHRIRALSSDAPLRKLFSKGKHSFSAVAELLSAPEEVVQEVIASETTVTRQEIKDKVKEVTGEIVTETPEAEQEMDGGKENPVDWDAADKESGRKPSAINEDEYTIHGMGDDEIEAWVPALQTPVYDRIEFYLALEFETEMDTMWAFFIFGVACTWEHDGHAPNKTETLARALMYRVQCHPDAETGREEFLPALEEAESVIEDFYSQSAE